MKRVLGDSSYTVFPCFALLPWRKHRRSEILLERLDGHSVGGRRTFSSPQKSLPYHPSCYCPQTPGSIPWFQASWLRFLGQFLLEILMGQSSQDQGDNSHTWLNNLCFILCARIVQPQSCIMGLCSSEQCFTSSALLSILHCCCVLVTTEGCVLNTLPFTSQTGNLKGQ